MTLAAILMIIGWPFMFYLKVWPGISLLMNDKLATWDVKLGYVYATFSFGGAMIPMLYGGKPWFGLIEFIFSK